MAAKTFFVVLAVLGALGAGPALAQTAATANYIVSLGGAIIATIAVKLGDDGRKYSIDLSADITGLGQLVANGTASIASAGRLGSRTLTSEKFALHTHANDEDFDVAIGFAGGDVATFVVEPPLLDNYNRVAIERKHLRGVNDMLAAFVLKGAALDQTICNRDLQIFTGLERFNIVMRYAQDDVATSKRTGYQGPVMLCSVRYIPVSGHFTTSEITSFLAGSDRIHIWYAPLGETGYFIPYRALLATSVGDLSIVLTAMKP